MPLLRIRRLRRPHLQLPGNYHVPHHLSQHCLRRWHVCHAERNQRPLPRITLHLLQFRIHPCQTNWSIQLLSWRFRSVICRQFSVSGRGRSEPVQDWTASPPSTTRQLPRAPLFESTLSAHQRKLELDKHMNEVPLLRIRRLRRPHLQLPGNYHVPHHLSQHCLRRWHVCHAERNQRPLPRITLHLLQFRIHPCQTNWSIQLLSWRFRSVICRQFSVSGRGRSEPVQDWTITSWATVHPNHYYIVSHASLASDCPSDATCALANPDNSDHEFELCVDGMCRLDARRNLRPLPRITLYLLRVWTHLRQTNWSIQLL